MLKRSKSLLSLHEDAAYVKFEDLKRVGEEKLHTTSSSPGDMCVMVDGGAKAMGDSGIGDKMLVEGDVLEGLEKKIDRLNETFLEQCSLLKTLKEEVRSSKAIMDRTDRGNSQILVNVLKTDVLQRFKNSSNKANKSDEEDGESTNINAKILLSAIESKQGCSIDKEIRENLVTFLQSDELKEEMVRATAASVKEMIGKCFTYDVSSIYLPILEKSHQRQLAHIDWIVEKAFAELEEKSSSLYKCVYKTTGALRRALERHQSLLETASSPGTDLINTIQYAVEEILQKELSQWRHKVLGLFSPQPSSDSTQISHYEDPAVLDIPSTPPQPAGPKASSIDHLMKSAVIVKQIRDGDVNGSFETALSAGDLSLVMGACRSADPAAIFTPPCSLEQHVLLSLMQQLATDMLHETQLKCRYLEEGIINLNVAHPGTRAHLPLVVGEVQKHLNKFLTTYPNHVASRRITLIVMAANNLLK